VKQSKAELQQHLQESLGFVKASAASFDAGSYGEAKRLAVTIRVLVHDTDKSKSLLTLLGYKSGMVFLTTALPFNPRNLAPYLGLVGMSIGSGGVRYSAHLEAASRVGTGKYLLFKDWWNMKVLVDGNKNTFNRRQLVLALANKDGGAHVDPNLDPQYADLTRGNSAGWIAVDGKGERPMESIELHSVRQIAHEVIHSRNGGCKRQPLARHDPLRPSCSTPRRSGLLRPIVHVPPPPYHHLSLTRSRHA
jgi:hypothetical protein